MSGDFIDSNVFVYLFDETDPAKRQRAESLVRTALEVCFGARAAWAQRLAAIAPGRGARWRA